ncbi:hypothetical protein [Lysobacter sp.]|uniref:hypothetical protein n=1 Tax=Lysobacter sp. TaxID=72226 RepID=UPI002D724522|nr:hypothetical protein [Lysobacter sp.]HZX76783.1 hypothetical protein [Lysobacter sp.]
MRTRKAGAEGSTPPIAIPAWPGRRHVHLIESRLRALDGIHRAAVLRAVARALDAHLAVIAGPHAGCERVAAALDDLLKELGAVRPTAAEAVAVPALSSARKATSLGSRGRREPR